MTDPPRVDDTAFRHKSRPGVWETDLSSALGASSTRSGRRKPSAKEASSTRRRANWKHWCLHGGVLALVLLSFAALR